MEKIYGATERHDQLIVFGTNRAILIYGYGEEDGQGFDYRHTFDHKPTKEEVHDILIAHINACTDEKVLSGYKWTVLHGDDAGRSVNVWLSAENQVNYKAKHDLALAYPHLIKFPVRFKISEDSEKNAIYEEFQSIEELATFYIGGVAYIERCIADGWQQKDGVKALEEEFGM